MNQTVLVMTLQSYLNNPVYRSGFIGLLQQKYYSSSTFVLHLTQDQKHFKYMQEYESLLVQTYSKVWDLTRDYWFNFIVTFQSCNPQVQGMQEGWESITFDPELQNETTKYIAPQHTQSFDLMGPPTQNSMVLVGGYRRGANGGTFGYIHYGHKVLLSLSLLIVSDHLTVGVTGDALLSKKHNRQLIQSFGTRSTLVKRFTEGFKPGVEVHIAHLDEPAGPTAEGDYDVLVVTEETEAAVGFINGIRVGHSLPPLHAYVVGMVGEKSVKLSSTQVREYVLQKNRISEEEFQYVRQEWMKLCPADLHDEYLLYFESVIVPMYSQVHRYYHTLHHLLVLLQLLEKFSSLVVNHKWVVFTIFFHDLVYYPKKSNNEEASNRMFVEFVVNVPQIQADWIRDAILSTISHSHKNIIGDDMAYFNDLDMYILGSDEQEYNQYAQDIRQEYIHVPDEEFRRKRIDVLRGFGEVFYTKVFRELYEERAQINMQSEIIKLSL